MSSIFDSKVYALRQECPFTTPSFTRFLGAMIENGAETVQFTIRHDHSQATRVWYELTWQQHGRNCRASSQKFDLLMWRAIEIYKQVEREEHHESVVNNRHDFRCLFGWVDGDGI